MKKLFGAIALTATLLAPSAFAGTLSSLIPQFSMGPYAGLRTGYSTSHDPLIGANVGYDIGFIRGELDYDRLGLRGTSSNVVTANGILQVPIGRYTPYGLAGVGYEWRNSPGYFADHENWASGSALWNVGGGLRYRVNDYVELDGRYRLMQPFKAALSLTHPYERSADPYSLMTVGVNVRF